MAKIFISYGDNAFKKALKRIGKEAKSLKLFDKVILYTEKDLPNYIINSPIFSFKRGGGYWLWKAYLINKTLENSKEGDIIIYADAGCVLNPSKEWQDYFNFLEEFNAIFFQFKPIEYGWKQYENKSAKIKYWLKQSAINYFQHLFKDTEWLEYNKIMGGAILVKKSPKLTIINEWLKIKLFRPELLMDPFGNELNENQTFLSAHRHDQALLTPLVYFFKEKEKLLVLPESSESNPKAPIYAARKRGPNKIPLVWSLKNKIRAFLSDQTYEKLKNVLKRSK